MNETSFENFSQALSDHGADAAIEMLRAEFKNSGDYFQLFEILKVRCRHQLGLSLLPIDNSDPGDKTDAFETCLLNACREVGTLLFQAGKPDEGWVYLQPVGDQTLAKDLLMDVPVTEENQSLIIDLGLGQNIAPAYAFEIMLKAFGTCNAITTIDVRASQGGFAADDLKAIAEILLESFYNDLLASVRNDVAQRNESVDNDSTLGTLLDRFPWLVRTTGHHVDATHLNSVVRIARNVDDVKHFRLARELCQYGQRLADDFKYPGDPPFETTYVDHEQYFGGLLEENEQDAIAHFQKKIADCEDADRVIVAEHTIAWLARMNRSEMALDLYLSHLAGKETWGIAPSIHQIADTPALKQRLAEHFRSSNDLLGFAMCQLQTAAQ